MRFRFGTDIGLVREENQDAVRCEYFGHNVLAVVCDGMGGERAGKEASELAIEEFFQRFSADYKESLSDEEIRKLLISSISAANSVIYTRARFDFKNFGMGTTFVAASVKDGRLLAANVGDSRLYVLRAPGRIRQVTVDHSLVEEMIQAGRIDRETARTLPDKNIITRAVGAEDDLSVDFFRETIMEGDILLLCSDGLTNMITDQEIARIVFSIRSLEEAADRLVYEANMAGGKDNISVILINPFDTGRRLV